MENEELVKLLKQCLFELQNIRALLYYNRAPHLRKEKDPEDPKKYLYYNVEDPVEFLRKDQGIDS